MAKNLLIVESPAKAKTIEKILGKDFQVKSSFGHIRDLAKEDMGIDIDNRFKPNYIISEGKEKVVKELKSLASKAEEVWLATDEDREGEAISWHLCEVLNLDPKKTKRIVFHEITKSAIKKAVENPRTVNLDLVNAQQARRVLDRVVGFEISPILWRKLSARGLSAGRVQSVAVKLIVERERDINQFKAESSFKVETLFDAGNTKQTFKAELNKKYSKEADADTFLEAVSQANYAVADTEVKMGKRTPSAPFTTSTLQQEASRKLGYSVSRTMQVAQRLYEEGKITYMRTDSVNLSEEAITQIGSSIERDYGKEYVQPRRYKNKNTNSQEAHEAIRPTDITDRDSGHPDTQKLYDLIWKRTIASQMADAKIEKTQIKIDISTRPEQFVATGEVIKFYGFLKVYVEGHDDEADDELGNDLLPEVAIGQVLQMHQMTATQRFTKPQPRYTEASLVKKLEELGIGRPSTYAPTITTILSRGYVEKREQLGQQRHYTQMVLKGGKVTKEIKTETVGADKGKLFPTDLGNVVTDFLSTYFQKIMDYAFTANIEASFDEIANGQRDWQAMLEEFYGPFHINVEETLEKAARVSGERLLGSHPETGLPVYAKLGRFGPMVQIGDADAEEAPKFASLKRNQSIETITLNEALDLFKLPLTLGEYEGHEVVVNIGRFGPYIKWNEKFVNIGRDKDPLDISFEAAIEMIQEKLAADAPIAHYQGHEVTKGTGRFGPYIKWNNLFINVPKKYNFNQLSQEDIETLIDAKLDKEANRYIKQWDVDGVAIENGRWGPFIRFKKKMIKIPKKADGEKYTAEELAQIDLALVKAMIEVEMPGAFTSKVTKKKTAASAAKKATSVKKAAAPKKAVAKKAAPKKK